MVVCRVMCTVRVACDVLCMRHDDAWCGVWCHVQGGKGSGVLGEVPRRIKTLVSHVYGVVWCGVVCVSHVYGVVWCGV